MHAVLARSAAVSKSGRTENGAASSTTDAATTSGSVSTPTAQKSGHAVTALPAPKSITKPKPGKAPADQGYSAAAALALFTSYADGADADVIGPEGFERLCGDAQIPLEGAMPLVLAWQLGSKEMANIEKQEWVKGTDALQISSLPILSSALTEVSDLLFTSKPALKPSTSSASPSVNSKTKRLPTGEPYDRTRYHKYARDRKAAFLELYGFCFALAKPASSRNIDMETASALWSVLLAPQYPVMSEMQEFVTEKGSYKGVNKDLWTMMLEFCQTVHPNLDNYEADGAWPTMLDDFVEWKKSKAGETAAAEA